VWFTEFAKALGIAGRQVDSHQRMCTKLQQRPLVAQIWGNDPAAYRQAVYRLRAWGVDGIDINMGCPQPGITARGACSALIKTPHLAVELIRAARAAAEDCSSYAQEAIKANGCFDPIVWQSPVPISVKTRVSFDHPPHTEAVRHWLATLLQEQPAALTVHGRSAAQQSEGLADWQWVQIAVEMREKISPCTLIIGNGDVTSRTEAMARVAYSGADGIMIGRGLFTDPSLFGEGGFPLWSREKKIALARWHLDAYQDFWGQGRNWEIIKKFFKIYLQGFEDADQLRQKIMNCHDYQSAREILNAERPE
jgi:tRNA-dihydrouridine synthase